MVRSRFWYGNLHTLIFNGVKDNHGNGVKLTDTELNRRYGELLPRELVVFSVRLLNLPNGKSQYWMLCLPNEMLQARIGNLQRGMQFYEKKPNDTSFNVLKRYVNGIEFTDVVPLVFDKNNETTSWLKENNLLDRKGVLPKQIATWFVFAQGKYVSPSIRLIIESHSLTSAIVSDIELPNDWVFDRSNRSAFKVISKHADAWFKKHNFKG